jgi:hypothetical protein
MPNTETDLDQSSKSSSEQLAEVERQPLSRALFVGLAVSVFVLGVIIYAGIHERAMAASNLGTVTERAAITTVNVVEPKSGAPLEEIVLPGNTQAFSTRPSTRVQMVILSAGTWTSARMLSKANCSLKLRPLRSTSNWNKPVRICKLPRQTSNWLRLRQRGGRTCSRQTAFPNKKPIRRSRI